MHDAAASPPQIEPLWASLSPLLHTRSDAVVESNDESSDCVQPPPSSRVLFLASPRLPVPPHIAASVVVAAVPEKAKHDRSASDERQ